MNSATTYSPSSNAASLAPVRGSLSELVAHMPIVLFVQTLRAALKRTA